MELLPWLRASGVWRDSRRVSGKAPRFTGLAAQRGPALRPPLGIVFAVASAMSPDLPASSLAGVPVLIVEDDAASAKLMSIVLSAEGCEVRVMTSAEEALQALKTFAARVLVLDLILPRMSGLLLAQRLKADPATRDLIIIAVSVLGSTSAEELAREAGCAAYVNKPFDTLSFPSLVRDCLKL
jgi:two-component system, cell cycle response regulator DivK